MYIKQKFYKLSQAALKQSIHSNNQLSLNIYFMQLIALMSALLSISYSIFPNYLQSENTSKFTFIGYLSKPYLLLDNYDVLQYVVFAFAIFFFLLSLLQVPLSKDNLIVKHKIFKQVVAITLIVNQIYDIWLFNLVIEILIIAQQSLTVRPTIILSMIYCVLTYLYRIIFTKKLLFLNQKNFNQSNCSALYYSIQIVNLIQICIFALSSDFQVSQQWQCILGLFRELLTILNIVFYRSFLQYSIELLYLSISLLTLLYNFLRIVQLNSQQEMDIIEIITIMSIPLLYTLAYKYQQVNLLLSIKKPLNIYQLEFLISYITQPFYYSRNRIFIETYLSTVNRNQELIPERSLGFTNKDLIDICVTLTDQHVDICKQDHLQYIALLLHQENYFSAYFLLNKLKIINKEGFSIRYGLYIESCHHSILLNLNVNNRILQNQQFEMAVQSFMRSERKNEQIQHKILEMFMKKLNYFQKFDFDDCDRMYNLSLQLVAEIENLIANIREAYKSYPSQKLQSALTFIYTELINDYFSANKMQKATSLDEDKLVYINQSKVDFMNNQWAYLVVNLSNFNVIRQSTNANEFFECSSLNMNEMIPPVIRDHHDEMIQDFLRTGKSRFYRNLDASIIYVNEYLRAVNFFIEIFIENDQLNALLFFQQDEDNVMYMLVDQQQELVTLSEEFKKVFGIPKSKRNLLTNLNIEYIIPKFQNLQIDKTQQQTMNIRFLSNTSLSEYMILREHMQNRKISQDIEEGYWHDQNNLDLYQAVCQIEQREFKYYLIKFNYIRQTHSKGSQSYSKSYTTQREISELDENINLMVPYEDSEPKYINDINIKNPDMIMLSNRESQNNTYLLNESDQRLAFQNSKNFDQTQQQFYIKQQIQDQEQQQFDSNKDVLDSYKEKDEGEGQSQITSLSGTKKCHFYKKYIVVDKMILSEDKTRTHKQLLWFLLIYSSIVLIRSILSLGIIDSFESYLTDIDLLQVKNYLFQPVESFILTRYTIINYNYQLDDGVITKEEADQLKEFPTSNLNLGFDDVQQNLGQILNRLTLQDFLAKYYVIYIYKTTNEGDEYNLTMRQTLSILVNYQYTFKAAYIYDGKSVSDSPYIFFSYRNLLTIYDAFDELNDEQYRDSLIRTSLDKDKEFSIYLPFILITFTILSMAFMVYMKILDKIGYILGLLAFNEQFTIERDKERYRYHIEQMQKSGEYIFKHSFNFHKREQTLKEQQKQLLSLTSSKRLQYSKQQLSYWQALLILIFHYFIFFGYCTFKYEYNKNYYNHYEPTAYFYKLMSDLGTNLPTIYSMREVLYYRWRYPFYTIQDHENILLQVQACLTQVQESTQYIQFYDPSIHLLSSEFNNYLKQLKEDNLCTLLNRDMFEKSVNICNITLGQSLQKGLSGALVYIYTSISNEMQINLFTNKTEPTYQELEGAFLISMLLKDVNKKMKSDFTMMTGQVRDNANVITILLIIYLILSVIFIILIVYNYLVKQYHLSKRFIYLVPQQTLFLDDTFERLAKSVMLEQEIIQ